MNGKLKLAELALAAALLASLALGMAGKPEAACGDWWGAMFPTLSMQAETGGTAQTFASSGGGKYVLRFRAAEMIRDVGRAVFSK
jgi:hypothetical protein